MEIDGEHVELQVSGERYSVRGPQGPDQELTETEADELRRHSEDLSARADASGLPLDDSLAPTTWLSGLRHTLPQDRLTVLVDTTTMFNAGVALHTRGQAPAPIGLLDLSVLTAAATLFDTIVIQPERFPAVDDIQDLTHVLQPTPDGQVELERAYGDVWERFSRPENQARYRARWATFLDVPSNELRLDLDSVRTLNEEMTYDYSSPGEIADAFGVAGGLPGREQQLADALGIQTVRTGFNDAIAGALKLPYLATSVRLPVSSDLVDQKTHLLWVLQQLIARASPQAPAEPPQFAPRIQIAAPLLLGLVLQRMSKPEDYRGALDEVRERFAPLRAQLLEDRKGALLEDKPQVIVKRFMKHLGATGATFAAAQDAVTATAQAGATMAGDPGFVTAALKIIGVVKPLELAHRAYLRLCRPEIYVLISVAHEARQLSLLNKRIEQIWGGELDATQQHQLDRFASLRANPFLTPTPLG